MLSGLRDPETGGPGILVRVLAALVVVGLAGLSAPALVDVARGLLAALG